MLRITHRIAAALLALFCAGHTGGLLAGRSPSPAAGVVLEAMRTVHFELNGADRTFERIFFGHGVLVSLYLAASALLAWKLATVAVASWPAFSAIAWGLVVAQIFTAVIAFTCFFAGPGVLTSAAVALMIVGNVRTALAARVASR